MIARLSLALAADARHDPSPPPGSFPGRSMPPEDVWPPLGRVVTNVGRPCDAPVRHDGLGDCCPPTARIDAPGRPAFTLVGKPGTSARLGVGSLGRGLGAAVIVAFTGGAHCCERYDVAAPGPGGWRHVVVTRTEATDRGSVRQTDFDYGPKPFPTGLDGDGSADFVMRDGAFADYADSRTPRVVANLVGRAFLIRTGYLAR